METIWSPSTFYVGIISNLQVGILENTNFYVGIVQNYGDQFGDHFELDYGYIDVSAILNSTLGTLQSST